MSYSVSIRGIFDGQNIELMECGDYTYNTMPMFYVKCKSVNSFSELDNRSCKEVAEILKPVIGDMETRPAFYQKMNPTNGWGNYEGFLQFLTTIYRGCVKFPSGYVSIS